MSSLWVEASIGYMSIGSEIKLASVLYKMKREGKMVIKKVFLVCLLFILALSIISCEAITIDTEKIKVEYDAGYAAGFSTGYAQGYKDGIETCNKAHEIIKGE